MKDITNGNIKNWVRQEESFFFRNLFHQHQSIMLLIDPVSGYIEDANAAATEFYGYAHEEFFQMHLSKLNPITEEELLKLRMSVLQKELNVFEGIHLLKDGSRRFVEVRSSPVMTGGVMLLFSIINDVTEKVTAQKKLQENELRFRKMFSEHDAVMLLVEPESGHIRDINLAAERFYGFPRIQFLSMNIADINIMKPWEIKQERAKALSQERNFFYFKHRLSNGDVRDVEVHSSPVNTGDEQLLFSIIHDISAKKKAEEELEAKILQLKALSDNLPGTIIYETLLTEEGIQTFSYLGEGAEKLFGYTSTEIREKPSLLMSSVHPEDRDLYLIKRNVAIETKSIFNIDFRSQTPDGQIKWLHVHSIPFRKSGKIQGWHGIISDITERKMIELSLSESEERFNTLYNKSSAVILLIHPESGRILDANQTAIRFYGYTYEELTSILITDLNATILPEEAKQIRANIVAGKMQVIEFTHRLRDESLRQLLANVIPIKLKSEQVLFATFTDITEHKKISENLRREQLLNENLKKELIYFEQEQYNSGISYELHENISQILASAKIYLSMFKENPAKQYGMLNKGFENVSLALKLINELSYSIAPSFQFMSLPESLKELGMLVLKDRHIELNFQSDADGHEIDNHLKIFVFRVAEEYLKKVSLSSGASETSMICKISEQDIILEIKDNGNPGPTVTDAMNKRIEELKERVLMTGGEIEFRHSHVNETSLFVKVLLNNGFDFETTKS